MAQQNWCLTTIKETCPLDPPGDTPGKPTGRHPHKEEPAIAVEISDKLFFDMVDLLREPKTLIPAEDKCVIRIEKRNDVLDRLLDIRRSIAEDYGTPPRPVHVADGATPVS